MRQRRTSPRVEKLRRMGRVWGVIFLSHAMGLAAQTPVTAGPLSLGRLFTAVEASNPRISAAGALRTPASRPPVDRRILNSNSPWKTGISPTSASTTRWG